jgi:hypothetical protein
VSTRALAWIAAFFGVLLAAGACLAVDRLGYLEEWETPQWSFENRMVSIVPFSVMYLRPARAGQPDGRFVFLDTVVEPDPEPRAEVNANVPHVRLGMQVRHPDGESWQEPKLVLWSLGQLGTLTAQEWLLEIRLVHERRADGTERDLLRAGFLHGTGAQTTYFYETGPEAEAKAPPLGWSRTERAGPGEAPEVEFAFAGGTARPP